MPISLPQLTGIITQAPPVGSYQSGGVGNLLQAHSQAETGRANQAREGQRKWEGEEQSRQFDERQRMLEEEAQRRAEEAQREAAREYLEKVREAVTAGGEMGPNMAALMPAAPLYGQDGEALLKQIYQNLSSWQQPVGGVMPPSNVPMPTGEIRF